MVSRIYLLNSFHPSMLPSPTALAIFKEIDLDTARELVRKSEVISAIGHPSGAQLVSQLLDIPVEANRIQIKLSSEDIGLVFAIMVRAKEEGKIYSFEELKELMKQGLIKIYLVKVMTEEDISKTVIDTIKEDCVNAYDCEQFHSIIKFISKLFMRGL